MTNGALAASYLAKATMRLDILRFSSNRRGTPTWSGRHRRSWNLALKGMLRQAGVETPRWHDVGGVLQEHRKRFPNVPASESNGSRQSPPGCAERELSFYGDDGFQTDGTLHARGCGTRDGRRPAGGLGRRDGDPCPLATAGRYTTKRRSRPPSGWVPNRWRGRSGTKCDRTQNSGGRRQVRGPVRVLGAAARHRQRAHGMSRGVPRCPGRTPNAAPCRPDCHDRFERGGGEPRRSPAPALDPRPKHFPNAGAHPTGSKVWT